MQRDSLLLKTYLKLENEQSNLFITNFQAIEIQTVLEETLCGTRTSLHKDGLICI